MNKAEKFYREKCDVITKELHPRDKEIIKLLEEYETSSKRWNEYPKTEPSYFENKEFLVLRFGIYAVETWIVKEDFAHWSDPNGITHWANILKKPTCWACGRELKNGKSYRDGLCIDCSRRG